jgi:hypothetical protein
MMDELSKAIFNLVDETNILASVLDSYEDAFDELIEHTQGVADSIDGLEMPRNTVPGVGQKKQVGGVEKGNVWRMALPERTNRGTRRFQSREGRVMENAIIPIEPPKRFEPDLEYWWRHSLERLAFGITKLQGLIRSGQLPVTKHRGLVFIRGEDLNRLSTRKPTIEDLKNWARMDHFMRDMQAPRIHSIQKRRRGNDR